MSELNPIPGILLKAIQEAPSGVTTLELGTQFGLSRMCVQKHCKTLTDRGLICWIRGTARALDASPALPVTYGELTKLVDKVILALYKEGPFPVTQRGREAVLSALCQHFAVRRHR